MHSRDFCGNEYGKLLSTHKRSGQYTTEKKQTSFKFLSTNETARMQYRSTKEGR
jgi:hypothetical protein